MSDTNTTARTPARPAGARTDAPSVSTRKRWERMGHLAANAREEGLAVGLRDGYAKGWRWGLVCGALLCAALGASAAVLLRML